MDPGAPCQIAILIGKAHSTPHTLLDSLRTLADAPERISIEWLFLCPRWRLTPREWNPFLVTYWLESKGSTPPSVTFSPPPARPKPLPEVAFCSLDLNCICHSPVLFPRHPGAKRHGRFIQQQENMGIRWGIRSRARAFPQIGKGTVAYAYPAV